MVGIGETSQILEALQAIKYKEYHVTTIYMQSQIMVGISQCSDMLELAYLD